VYINALNICATSFPYSVISKCLDISKHLVWDADAVGYLRELDMELIITHLPLFIRKFNTLNIAEQDSLIAFYADIENFSAYPEYQHLVNDLKALHQDALCKKLVMAKRKRMRSRDH
jgi:hypothetical protein